MCVTPATRTRTAQDNAAAASRRDPSAGYGPYGCQAGYVWREARPSDLVCVTPNIRDQAKVDNAAAASRRNSITLTLTRSNGKHVVNATNINNGRATVGLWFSNLKPIKSWKVNVSGNRLRAPHRQSASAQRPAERLLSGQGPVLGALVATRLHHVLRPDRLTERLTSAPGSRPPSRPGPRPTRSSARATEFALPIEGMHLVAGSAECLVTARACGDGR